MADGDSDNPSGLLSVDDIVDGDHAALYDGEHAAGSADDALRVIAAVKRFFSELNAGSRIADGSQSAVERESSIADALLRGVGSRAPGAEELADARTWDRLKVLDRIGHGAYGDVYRAWNPTLKKIVALKLTRYSSERDAERALHEAQLLASIPRHENVIQIHDAHRIGHEVGICMEFLRGASLETLLQAHGEIGSEEAMVYGKALCRGLAHVHNNAGVFHRDIKASNVVKAAGGHLVLIDFGLGEAIPAGDAQAAHSLAGTLQYMAPELFAGRSASHQTDIYSLGVLMFHLVTGKYPVETNGGIKEDYEHAHAEGRRLRLTDARANLPKAFVDAVERAIDPDPSRRYKSAAELEAALSADAAARTMDWSTLILWSVLGIAGALTVTGAVTSRVFNLALQRSDFSTETVGDWFQLGWQSNVQPAADLLAQFLTVCLVAFLARGACSVSVRCRGLLETSRSQLALLARRFGLHNPAVLVPWLLLLSVTALAATWWTFSDLLGAVVQTALPQSNVSTAPIDRLRFFAPSSRPYYGLYREIAAYLFAALLLMWSYAARVCRRATGSLRHPALLAGFALTFVSFVALDVPYRLVLHPTFVATKWTGYDCYTLGERAESRELFCPSLFPRIRVVAKSAQVELSDPRNIFETFSQ